MLQAKVAIVTGGGTGIGKAIGLKMAKNRAKVAIASRNRSHLAEAADAFEALGLPVLPISMDVRNKQDIQRAIDAVVSQWGGINILVNNAGISGLSLIDDADDSQWFDILDTNLNGMYLVTKAVLKQMPDDGEGRVINISSVLGKFGVPGYTAYCTTKHGMIGFTRALALEVVSRGDHCQYRLPRLGRHGNGNARHKGDRGVAGHHAGAIQSPSRGRCAHQAIFRRRRNCRAGLLSRFGSG